MSVNSLRLNDFVQRPPDQNDGAWISAKGNAKIRHGEITKEFVRLTNSEISRLIDSLPQCATVVEGSFQIKSKLASSPATPVSHEAALPTIPTVARQHSFPKTRQPQSGGLRPPWDVGQVESNGGHVGLGGQGISLRQMFLGSILQRIPFVIKISAIRRFVRVLNTK